MWNTLDKLPKCETENCSVGVNFYDADGAVYQGYLQVDHEFLFWYSYEHKSYIENVKGWASLPVAPGNAQQQLEPDNGQAVAG